MTSPDTAPAAAERWNSRLWGTLLVLCAAMFLDALDVSMVGVALPSIGTDLDLSTASLQWVVSGYILGYGGLLLLGGRAADLLGRRRVFLIALAVFAVASLLGGLVDSGSLLIASRFIKGVSAAFTAPAGLSIITTTFAEGPVRNRALSIYTTCAATGFSMGLVLSGLLTEVGWRWTMLLPAPVAVLAVAMGMKLIPRGPVARREPGQGYDLAGAVTGTASMLLLVFTVVEAPNAGWASARTLLSFAAFAVLLAAFTAVERRTASPLVRLGILRSGGQIRANLGAVAFFGSYVGFQFLVTQYMQNLLGWSALHTALAFLPAGALVAVASTRIGPLVDRFGTPRVIAVGFALLAAAYGLFLRVGIEPRFLGVILPTMILLGMACALVFPSLNIQATTGVDDNEQGMVSGLLNTSIQVGGAIVLAVVTAVVTASAKDGGTSHQAVLDSYRPGLVVVTVFAVIGLLLTLTGVRRRHVPHSVIVAQGTAGQGTAGQGAAGQGTAGQGSAGRKETVQAGTARADAVDAGTAPTGNAPVQDGIQVPLGK
ncbi:MFS transporter [Wenjunlia tyrosinilytica]|uniref:MFS transporter n=1 Tax=Wenjunlia tyrosinilytica TaxID=1544741 RepID=A0A917ZUR8_9ACTN|nr:MFS transporter [Wenjunlia tyrosinilytica]GGO96278.1 MFS transporter [Wenjunlia tyrosinilytica]